MAVALRIGSSAASGGAPQNVAQITSDAQEYEFNALVPLKYWLRTAGALIQQAGIYMGEGDDEMTYFLLFRHAHLVLTNLATHPEAKKYSAELKALKREVSLNLEALDALKPRINKRYEEHMKLNKERDIRRQQTNRLSQRHESPDQFGPVASRVQTVRGHENHDVAARLAQQEFSRRAPTRQRSSKEQSIEKEDLSSRLQAIRMRIEPNNQAVVKNDESMARNQTTGTGYSYPSIPSAQVRDTTPRYAPEPVPRGKPAVPFGAPAIPPKPSRPNVVEPPPKPDKAAAQPQSASKTETEPAYSFAPGAYLENGVPLRTIFLPPTLRTTFLRVAHQNTIKNLETCGFLAGTLRANALFVSTLVIPSQTSSSDTCEMTNESELFDYVDSHELMILGWIHTHPTQTCFMSSRDLHTHAGYQMMLAESVAIVCAPSKGDTTHGGDWGAYRLTDPPGKTAILQCQKPGIFHPHEVDNIYTDAMRPGHVMEIKGMDFEVVDLRSNG